MNIFVKSVDVATCMIVIMYDAVVSRGAAKVQTVTKLPDTFNPETDLAVGLGAGTGGKYVFDLSDHDFTDEEIDHDTVRGLHSDGVTLRNIAGDAWKVFGRDFIATKLGIDVRRPDSSDNAFLTLIGTADQAKSVDCIYNIIDDGLMTDVDYVTTAPKDVMRDSPFWYVTPMEKTRMFITCESILLSQISRAFSEYITEKYTETVASDILTAISVEQ